MRLFEGVYEEQEKLPTVYSKQRKICNIMRSFVFRLLNLAGTTVSLQILRKIQRVIMDESAQGL